MSARRLSAPILAFGLALVLAGCGGRQAPPPAPAQTLDGSHWILMEIAGAPATSPATLSLSGGRYSGDGPCNRFTGAWTHGADGLRLSRGLSTTMICPTMDVETALFAAFDRTRDARLGGSTLELLDDRGRSLARFQRAK